MDPQFHDFVAKVTARKHGLKKEKEEIEARRRKEKDQVNSECNDNQEKARNEYSLSLQKLQADFQAKCQEFDRYRRDALATIDNKFDNEIQNMARKRAAEKAKILEEQCELLTRMVLAKVTAKVAPTPVNRDMVQRALEPTANISPAKKTTTSEKGSKTEIRSVVTPSNRSITRSSAVPSTPENNRPTSKLFSLSNEFLKYQSVLALPYHKPPVFMKLLVRLSRITGYLMS